MLHLLKVFEQHKKCDIVFSRHREFRGKLYVDEERDQGKTYISYDDIPKKVISDSNNHFVWNMMIKAEIAQKENLHRYVLRKIFVISETVPCIVEKWPFWMRHYIFTDEIMRTQ